MPAKAAIVPSGSLSPEQPLNRRQNEQQGHDIRPASHYGIDEVVEDGADDVLPPQVLDAELQTALARPSASKPLLCRQFGGVSDARSPPTVIEGGVAHDLIHVNCTPIPGVAAAGDRLVATILYKGHGHYHTPANTASRAAGEQEGGKAHLSRSDANDSNDAERELPPNLAPTIEPTSFPMELPAEDPEPPRDGLYGAYVSPICIAAFLHLMATFPRRAVANGEDDGGNRTGSDLKASHRYLDSATQPHVVEVLLHPAPVLALTDLRRHEQLYRFEREWNVEVVLQHDTLWRRHPRLVVFDMDSTLITQEVIDLLAEAVTPEVAARVADITHRAMAGQLQFEEAFRERVHMLAGLPATLFDSLRPRLDVTKGVPALLRALRRLGVRTAVLSGGFQPLTGWLAGQLKIDHAHANHVVVGADGRLTGEVTGAIVGRERKCELLKQIAAEENIDLRQVVAVGDGANDLLMLETAGLGVAWHAKPVLQLAADARLNRPSLLDLLFLFGFTSTEIAELAAEEELPRSDN
ncbi:phosphoserine phosphatase [Grosmannia clavigera kw1407]|uniref:phosphoserine phosphatase n=1 Tax=Grosmannia clavigera (strain kw1407 / UAMH 11150) TaxID=655863 RepID=F0XJZ0_GROCL|nr:phosphoserine phosphatase [Grosmannia clavigera kw1407]EFX01931.1 phosphoserine phosphatase [Grosmannia clavigera kw1407]